LDKLLLRKRALSETVNDQLKNICQIEHTRHRSVANFVVNLLAALVAYAYQEKKPSLNLRPDDLAALPATVFSALLHRTHVKKGKTPVLSAKDTSILLDSIDTSFVIGLRDHALIGLMAYFFARVSAVENMGRKDYYQNGKRWWIRLHEKGWKFHDFGKLIRVNPDQFAKIKRPRHTPRAQLSL